MLATEFEKTELTNAGKKPKISGAAPWDGVTGKGEKVYHVTV